MPEATDLLTLNRRTALGLAPGILGFVRPLGVGETPIPLASPRRNAPEPDETGQDTDLLAACAEFCRLEDERDAVEGPKTDEEWGVVHDDYDARQSPLLDVIVGTRAVTLAGHRARAAALDAFLKLMDCEILDYLTSECWDKRMTGALIRDLVRP